MRPFDRSTHHPRPSKGRARPPLARRPFCRPALEQLEDRCVPAFLKVTSNGDAIAPATPTSDPDTFLCVSLRSAILEANARAGADTIYFDISGAGPHTITPGSALPAITGPVNLLGRNLTGSDRIELRGTSAGKADGLLITGGGSDVQALVINGFMGNGIKITGGGGNIIEQCYIGTDRTGSQDLGNGGDGVFIENSANNIIGLGTYYDTAGNVISGNEGCGVRILGGPSTGNWMRGNFIGTDGAGAAALGNTKDGVRIDAPGNKVGGVADGEGNVISGNKEYGVQIVGVAAAKNVMQGNLVGTDKAGAAALGNALSGVRIDNAADNAIGGTAVESGNVISGNGQDGVLIGGPGATRNLLQGNHIGIDKAGAVSLGNTQVGVRILGAANNTVGGAAAPARNVISGNGEDGVLIAAPGATGNLVQGNYIGTDKTGAVALGNGETGVLISTNAANNTIGGIAATPGTAPGNVISGNGRHGVQIAEATRNQVQGNLVGTDATGTKSLGNGLDGVIILGDAIILGIPNNTIGGAAAGAGNVISGNGRHGVQIADGGATNNQVQGNLIGTNALGMAPLGNSGVGVLLDNVAGNTIGGAAAAPGTPPGNVISGNLEDGVRITGAGATTNQVQGNLIGTDKAGTAALGNTQNGVRIDGAADNTIGGTTVGSVNVISGNDENGVLIVSPGATGNLVRGNLIGTDKAGTAAWGNKETGVLIGTGATNNTVGREAVEPAGVPTNLISGNRRHGVQLAAGAMENRVQGNFIGTDVNSQALGNGLDGVIILGVSNRNKIGGTAGWARNTIAFNGVAVTPGTGNRGNGVTVESGTGNTILGNSIYSNRGLGIDLGNDGVTPNDGRDVDDGANKLQNFPVVALTTDAGGRTRIQALLHGTPNTEFRVEFFSNTARDPSGYGEGQTFWDFTVVRTDRDGNATIDVTVPAGGQLFTATATDPDGNTSEFSPAVRMDLDVNGDKDITDPVDGAANYLPGYEGNTPRVATGATFNTATYVGQKMKIVVEGVGRDSGITAVVFRITRVTSLPGYAVNATDRAVEGGNRRDDFSFDERRNRDLFTVDRSTTEAQGGRMEADRTWVDFWAKDYGGSARVTAEFRKDGATVLTLTLDVPRDEDNDGLADRWEEEMVRQWNAQYGQNRPVDNAFFAPNDDKEERDPDGANTDGGTDMNQHAAAGDGRTVLAEYRGFILDGGGHDWAGNNAHTGGHVRLNPAYKEVLLEVDAMTGVTNMPNRAGITGWIDAISVGFSQAADGAGVRMFYVLDDLATAHTEFQPGPGHGQDQNTLMRNYLQDNVHAQLTTFRHLMLVDSFFGLGTSGLTWDDRGSLYAVDSGHRFATGFGIPVNTSHAAYITHELAHLFITAAGDDGNEHFNDTNGNGTGAQADDKRRVLWNYNFNYATQTKTLNGAIGAAAVEITLNNVDNLTTAGIVRIGAELIKYTGITGNRLTGCTRGWNGTAAAAHANGDVMTPVYSAEEMKQILYGLGVTRLMTIR